NTYDRRGRLFTVFQATNVTQLRYGDGGELVSESRNGYTVTNRYDALDRRTNQVFMIGTTPQVTNVFAYDQSNGRLTNVSEGVVSAGYDYLANSELINQITFRSNSTTRMVTTKQYDLLNRLLSISNQPSASGVAPSFHSYSYNSAN